MSSSRLAALSTGAALTAFLVGVVLLLRLLLPKPPSLVEDFPRSQGPGGAPVQIIEYSDFECPACSAAQPLLQQLRDRYPEKVRLVYQHFPLDGHRRSPQAHHAAECAARQKKFWPFHDRLYREQSVWSKTEGSVIEIFLRFALEQGLDVDEFARCLSDPSVERTILEERTAGSGFGINSTPSFFVNGKLIIGAQSVEEEAERILSK